MKKVLLLLVMGLLFASCGAKKTITESTTKKVDSTHVETQIVAEVQSELMSSVEIKKNIVTNEEFEIEPIDANTEIEVNGVKYKNAKIKIKKTTADNSVETNETLAKTAFKSVFNEVKTAVATIETSDKTEVRRSAMWSLSFWIILFLVILAIIIRYRKYFSVL
jgi:hypothetical protein